MTFFPVIYDVIFINLLIYQKKFYAHRIIAKSL